MTTLLKPYVTALLALLLFAAADLAAQDTDAGGRGGQAFGAAGVGLQAYDVDAVNAALNAAGFPSVEQTAIRATFSSGVRRAGRLRSWGEFYLDNFSVGDERVTRTGGGIVGTRDNARSTRMGALGVSLGLDVDLLYPSAWNLYLGGALELGGGRLLTTSVTEDPNGSPFEASTSENKFVFGTIGFRPQVTLESVQFWSKRGGGTRVFLTGGYRFGASVDIGRENFASRTLPFELGTAGAYGQIGFVGTGPIRRRGR